MTNIQIMEDVTASVFGMLFVASTAITEFMPPSRKTKTVSLLLLLAAGVSMWQRVHLPVSLLTADALFVTSAAGWAVLIACVAPKWLREIKASARD
jgi:predicted tellurium resistance membrane protein TerC